MKVRERAAILQPGVAQKPSVGLAHFQTVATTRLNSHENLTLTFDIPGIENENVYSIEVHEHFANIGFEYLPGIDTDQYLGEWAPVAGIKKIANMVTAIFNELNLKPKRIVVGIQEKNTIGDSDYGGRAITSCDGIVFFQLELDPPISDIDYWERLLWHESMHVKYTLEKRFPSIWPSYTPQDAPLWALDSIVHFSLDGWLERNNKPTIRFSTDDSNVSSLKSFRLSQLRNDLKGYGIIYSEDSLKRIADDLWQRETDIREVYEIMKKLGLVIPENTPLGKYLAMH